MSTTTGGGGGIGIGGKALRQLRALGHALDPVIAVGKSGITAGLVAETKILLERHELIKVRVMSEAPVDRREAATALADATDATLAQVLGRTFLLYRRNAKKPKIALLRDGKSDGKSDGKRDGKREPTAKTPKSPRT